jgi:hypothetical protein
VKYSVSDILICTHSRHILRYDLDLSLHISVGSYDNIAINSCDFVVCEQEDWLFYVASGPYCLSSMNFSSDELAEKANHPTVLMKSPPFTLEFNH